MNSGPIIDRRTALRGSLGLLAGVGLTALTAGEGHAQTLTLGQQLIQTVATKSGAPYLLGAEGPDYFDCSGLVYWGWRQLGIKVVRTADEQWHASKPVSASNLKAGDSIFFINSSGVAKHTLLWAGDGTGKVWQASHLYAPCSCVTYCDMPAYSGRIEYGRLVRY